MPPGLCSPPLPQALKKLTGLCSQVAPIFASGTHDERFYVTMKASPRPQQQQYSTSYRI